MFIVAVALLTFYVNEAWAVFVFRRYISILITRALGNTINSFYFIILAC